ncbi:MAG: YihY/virulence factor BrkB family protein [Bacteroidetes bacterium]|nr:YihY/virulence factor BrkB family protein [Bacteroidota bacterium]
MKWLHTSLIRFRFYQKFIQFTQRVSFPGFQGESIYAVMYFFYKQMSDEDLNMRSSALAFDFFIALFPAIIFLFTLIPFIPINDTKDEVLKFFEQVLDKSTFETIKVTINDILRKKHSGVLSFGFVLAFFQCTYHRFGGPDYRWRMGYTVASLASLDQGQNGGLGAYHQSMGNLCGLVFYYHLIVILFCSVEKAQMEIYKHGLHACCYTFTNFYHPIFVLRE